MSFEIEHSEWNQNVICGAKMIACDDTLDVCGGWDKIEIKSNP